jgi:hypothetical protein
LGSEFVVDRKEDGKEAAAAGVAELAGDDKDGMAA